MDENQTLNRKAGARILTLTLILEATVVTTVRLFCPITQLFHSKIQQLQANWGEIRVAALCWFFIAPLCK